MSTNEAELDQAAQTIWNYMLLHQPLKPHDAIFILGSRDDRVAEYGAQLFIKGYGQRVIISGGTAHSNDLLRTNWAENTEAEHFAVIAGNLGVPAEKLILEIQATNTGQNIQFTASLLQTKRLRIDSFILVQKPYMERRTYATFKKQWPGPADVMVTSPPIPYQAYFNESQPKSEIWNIMVGDLQRIREYPRLGFQTEQAIPASVWQAYEQLVAAGYDKHLMAEAKK